MYSRFAERQGWQVEVISESPGDVGGYKEIIARIMGQGAYSKLKFESGGHRVQRVPETETQGRIHTSACTVAILPEANAIGDVVLNPADIARVAEILAVSLEEGMRTLKMDGIEKVLQGITDMPQVRAVCIK